MLERGTVSEVGHVLETSLDTPPPIAGPSAMALMGLNLAFFQGDMLSPAKCKPTDSLEKVPDGPTSVGTQVPGGKLDEEERI